MNQKPTLNIEAGSHVSATDHSQITITNPTAVHNLFAAQLKTKTLAADKFEMKAKNVQLMLGVQNPDAVPVNQVEHRESCERKCEEKPDNNSAKVRALKAWQSLMNRQSFKEYLVSNKINVGNDSDFSELILNKLQFVGKPLMHMDFSKSYLSGCVFSSKTLKNVTFELANITNVDIDEEMLSRTNFSDLIVCHDCAGNKFKEQRERVDRAIEIMLTRYAPFIELMNNENSLKVSANEVWGKGNDFVLFQVPYIEKIIDSMSDEFVDQCDSMRYAK